MNLQEIATAHGISVDEVRMRYLQLRAALWKSDYTIFARDVLKIRTKSGDLEPLVFNPAQKILHEAAEKQLKEERWVRLTGLKGRRQGFSTYVAGRGYWRATLWDRQNIYILSHEMASSEALFGMVDLMQQKHPFPPQIGTDNAKTLEFKVRGSSYQVATAGQKAGGRGTAVSFFHGSEAAWWTNAPDHFASSVQSVDEVRGVWGTLWTRPEKPLPFEERYSVIEGWVKAPSEIWLETTSAGPQGEFYKKYKDAQKGLGRYRPVFVPWHVQAEYVVDGDFVPGRDPEEDEEPSEAEYQELHGLSNEQMLWRRDKIQEMTLPRFRQEFPVDVEEAFAEANLEGVYIKPNLVLKARKRNLEMPDAPLIMGVDPAGNGGDRFAVCGRRGDKVTFLEFRHRLEHDAAVAWLCSLIDEHDPARMNVDLGSMGANIVSSVRNRGPKYAKVIRGVNFGATSLAKVAQPKRTGPVNRRAEMYAGLREWLVEGGDIPDDGDLASDISAPKVKYKQNNDWLLESKTDLKGRGIRSTDLSDALALTFASKEWFDTWSSPKKYNTFSGEVAARQPVMLTPGSYTESGPNSWMA